MTPSSEKKKEMQSVNPFPDLPLSTRITTSLMHFLFQMRIKACDGIEELLNSERIAVGQNDADSEKQISKAILFSYDTPRFMKEKKESVE
ncbi:hypothetical protein V5799_009802 [Amblyomma americanum]|uniref:Uncharacterized protein n=1 Tax=Amblyomma americanum TaxID=6943 RepID=A0AAQ4F9F5_AMBAM